MSQQDTRDALLDAARRMVQERGYNGFSYKDLANEVGVRTSSIHYYFEAKADLARVLMERYLDELKSATAAIDRGTGTIESKLKKYFAIYKQTESGGAICMCGSLASDVETLPRQVQEIVSDYLGFNVDWVASKIQAGVRAGEFAFSGNATDAAATLVASLQGGLILSRARDGSSTLDRVRRTFFHALNTA